MGRLFFAFEIELRPGCRRAPSPACGRGLGRGCHLVGIVGGVPRKSVAEEPSPAALYERVDLPRKRGRCIEPVAALNTHAACRSGVQANSG
ncbi:hypothetical protein ACVWXO_001557 [Bradyrhizobium sp. LM2.7]